MGKKPERVRDKSLSRTDAYRIDPNAVIIDENASGRDDEGVAERAAIERLAASIEEIGVVVPIIVRMRERNLVCLDGRLRVLAVRQLIKKGVAIPHIPAVQESRTLFGDQYMAATIARHRVEPLTEQRVEELLTQLAAARWDSQKIARATGVSLEQARQTVERVRVLPRRHRKVEPALTDARLVTMLQETLKAIGDSRTLAQARGVASRLRSEIEKAEKVKPKVKS